MTATVDPAPKQMARFVVMYGPLREGARAVDRG
jgi:hypothetical protein